MISSIEISPNSRACCSSCDKRIEKGELRGIEYYHTSYYSSHRYYCQKCSERLIEEVVKEYNQVLFKKINNLEQGN